MDRNFQDFLKQKLGGQQDKVNWAETLQAFETIKRSFRGDERTESIPVGNIPDSAEDNITNGKMLIEG